MADTTETKRERKKAFATKAGKVAKDTGLNISAAIAGGVVGTIAPTMLSGFGGLAAIIVGNSIDDKGQPKKQAINTWLKIFGATLVATVPLRLFGVMQRTDGTQPPEPNAKEKVKLYFKALASKFYLDKIFKGKAPAQTPGDEGTDSNLNGFGLGDLEALDAMTRQLEAGAMDFAARNPNQLPGATYQTEEAQNSMAGLDFSMM